MKNYSISALLNSKGLLVCSVCGKEFEPNDDTKYIISDGYTCNWECFANEAKRQDAEKVKRKEGKRSKESNL